MESCVYIPNCRNKQGKLVPSRFFSDLLKYTDNDRTLAIKYYKIGKDERFLNAVGNDAKFDENGEITLASFLHNSNLSIDKQKLLDRLNDELGSKQTYSYEEAMSRITSFNGQNQFNDVYMATLKRQDNGQYGISVVERTERQKEMLRNEIENATLQDRLRSLLRFHGVEVGFLDDSDVENGRYSTLHAKQNANGLYNLINIKDGKNGDRALSEETGHFIVGAMGNDLLVQRLVENMTEEVQKQVLGDEYEKRDMGTSSQRECAGILVGRALYDNYQVGEFRSLLKRIINRAKQLFYSITGNEVRQMLLDSQMIADKFARDFLSGNFNGNIQNALSQQEELYQKHIFSGPKQSEITSSKQAIGVIFKTVDILVAKLDSTGNKKQAQELKDMMDDIRPGISNLQQKGAQLEKAMLTRALATVLLKYKRMFVDDKTIYNKLNDMKISEDFSNIGSVGMLISQVDAILDGVQETIKMFGILVKDQVYKDSMSSTTALDQGNTEITDALKVLERINDAITVDKENSPCLRTIFKKAQEKYMDAMVSNASGGKKLYYHLGSVLRQHSLRLRKQLENKRSKVEKQKDRLRKELQKTNKELDSNRFFEIHRELGKLYDEGDNLDKELSKIASQNIERKEYQWSVLPNDLSFFEYLTRTMMNADLTAQLISREVERQTYESKLRKQQDNITIKRLMNEAKQFDIYKDEDGNIITEHEYNEAKKNGRKVTYQKGLDNEDLYEKTFIYFDSKRRQISKKQYDELPENQRSRKEVCSNYILSKFKLAQLDREYEEYKQEELDRFRLEMSSRLSQYWFEDNDGNKIPVTDDDGNEIRIRNIDDFNKWKSICAEEKRNYHPVRKIGNFSPSILRALYRKRMRKIWINWRKGYVRDGQYIQGKYQYNQKSDSWDIKDEYINPVFMDMCNKVRGFEQWHGKLIKLKESFDSNLDSGATELYRAPQFRKKSWGFSRLRSTAKRLFEEGTDQDIRDQMEDITMQTIMEEYIPQDSGDDLLGELADAYNDRIDLEKHKRIRTYGIRKIDNLQEMSTDFFVNLSLYNEMSNNYGILSQLKKNIYATLSALKLREVGGQGIDIAGSSRSYRKIQKHLDNRLFKNSDFDSNKRWKKALQKLLDWATIMAAKMYLGGNIHGGMVNWETGFHEILREAMAQQNWDVKDLLDAERIYLGFYRGKENKIKNKTDDKQIDNAIRIFWDSAFSRKTAVIERLGIVNALNTQIDVGERTFLDKTSDKIDKFLFFPYSIGEKWMQTIPYIMMSRNYDLYIPDELNDNLDSWKEEREKDKAQFDKRQEKRRREGKDVEEWIPEQKISLFDAYERSVGYYQWVKRGNKLIRIYIDKDQYSKVLNDLAKQFRDQHPDYTEEQLGKELPAFVNQKKEGFLGMEKEKLVEFQKNTYIKSKEALHIYNVAGQITSKINQALSEKQELVLSDQEKEFLQEHNINVNVEDFKTWSDCYDQLKKLREKQFFNEKDESDFIVQTRHICSNLHGIYNKADRSLIQEGFFTKSMMAMRGYALGMINERFGAGFTNSITGDYEEGYWITTFRVLRDMTYDFKKTARFLFLNWIGGERTAELMREMGYSNYQIANMKRMKGNLIELLALYLLKTLWAGPDSPDEEEDDEEEEKRRRQVVLDNINAQNNNAKFVQKFLKRKDGDKIYNGVTYSDLRKQFKNIPTDELTAFYNNSYNEETILSNLYNVYRDVQEEQERLRNQSQFEFLVAKVQEQWENGELFSAIAYADLDRTLLEQLGFFPFAINISMGESGRDAGIIPIGFEALVDIADLARLWTGAQYYGWKYSEDELDDILKNNIDDTNMFEEFLFKNPKDVYYVRKNKALVVERGDPKWKRQVAKILPYYKYMFFLSDPRKAAENYRFFNVKRG